MAYSFEKRIARAKELAESHAAAREILEFYAHIARFQERIFKDVAASGESRVEALTRYFPEFLKLVGEIGPAGLAEQGSRIENPAALLEACWNGESPDDRFFGLALVQPFAEALASRGSIERQGLQGVCPFCGAWPAVAVLRGEGDGARRSLQCSVCSTEWAFRRILCWNCGEEDKEKLPVYTADRHPHVRVEACDTCRVYIKAVDLTVDGRAVPAADSIATIDLDIWAEEHGYQTLAASIVGG